MEPTRILVSLNGSETDDEAIKLACTLARQNKSQIHAIYVITIKRSLPLEAESVDETVEVKKVLSRIENLAKEKGCRAEATLYSARDVGTAIIEKAVAIKANVIIMGVKYEQRFGQFRLGDTVPHVLKNAPCKVILYQQSIL